MVLATWWGWRNLASIALAIVLAFFFGYLLSYTSVRRHGLPHRDGVRLALAADTVSIALMELVDNGVIALVPGALHARPTDRLFWASLRGGFAVAFLVTTPVNRWLIGRGRGHAVVHAHR